MAKWKVSGVVLCMAFVSGGCMDQYNPRPYWAQWKSERHLAHRVMPKLKSNGSLPDQLLPKKHVDVASVSASVEYLKPIRFVEGKMDVMPKAADLADNAGSGGGGGIPQNIQNAYQTNCQMCHGPDGKGVPAMGARDFTNAEWQKTTADERIIEVITKGGAATGLKPTMPPWAHLGDEVIKGLVKKIRAFAP